MNFAVPCASLFMMYALDRAIAWGAAVGAGHARPVPAQSTKVAMLNPEQAKYTEQRREFWDEFARQIHRWQPLRRYYRDQLARWFAFAIPPGERVLEIGSGTGDLLAALRPSLGVGIDFSAEMVRLAGQRHPELRFFHADAHDFRLEEKFDACHLLRSHQRRLGRADRSESHRGPLSSGDTSLSRTSTAACGKLRAAWPRC